MAGTRCVRRLFNRFSCLSSHFFPLPILTPRHTPSTLAHKKPQSDFDGHAKRSSFNIQAYANVYGTKCAGIMNLPHAAPNEFFAEGFWGNKCILAADAAYLDLGGGCVADATIHNRFIMGNNTIYTPNAAPTISCGKTYSFAEWEKLGLDKGSSAATLPTAAQIVAWARETLNM